MAQNKANEISNSLANTATDTIVGKGANPIVKELLSTTIKNKIKDKSDQITGDSVGTIDEKIKGHVQSLNERFKNKTPEEIKDLKNFFKGKDPSDLQNMIQNLDPEKETDGTNGDSKTVAATNGENVEATKGDKKDNGEILDGSEKKNEADSQENHSKGLCSIHFESFIKLMFL